MQMKKAGAAAVEWLSITVATAIVAAAVYFFLIPSQVPVGSVSSLAMVLGTMIPLPISAITMILNVTLLLLGFLFIGREFGAKTVYTSLLLPVFLGVLEQLFPGFTSLMGDPFLDVVCYIFLVSVGLSMLFNRNASSGGLDIVAKFLNKYLHMELGKAMALSGMCVALSAVFVYDGKTVVLSVLGTYLSGLVLDPYIDCLAEGLVKDGQLICLTRLADTQVTNPNVWLTGSSQEELRAFLYGYERSFPGENLPEDLGGVVADLTVNRHQVSQVTLKRESIQAKVLSVGEEAIELEGYGKVQEELLVL